VLIALVAQRAADDVERRRAAGERLPLYGLPFAVKDNIDVAGLPTTAACPEYAYTPERSAEVVRRLLAAGAVLIGKTNLDQFATGLVGVRSPYGIPENPFDPLIIPGGSSSGSAVAVATGLVSFALGTDTAGSGRIPAGFNNIVGVKPSRGLLSTAGVVPACRSLDCVSVFGLLVEDACAVVDVAKGYDPEDAFSRRDADTMNVAPHVLAGGFRFGVPAGGDREFFQDEQARERFLAAIGEMLKLGGHCVEVHFRPFRDVARLLYEGPWVAERAAALESFFKEKPGAMLPIIKDIVGDATRYDAVATFRAQYRLEALRRATEDEWQRMDLLMVPTAPTVYTIAQVLADPRRLNANLGVYTNFVNLLDLAAIAVPNGLRNDGIPSGITLIGPRGRDADLAAVGAAYHHRVSATLGATKHALPPPRLDAHAPRSGGQAAGIQVAVVGAHLTGQPLNHQLLEAGARLVHQGTTTAAYRLFLLPDTTPPKPGLVRVAQGEGVAIEVEVWELAPAAFGAFVANVPSPLCIGTILLAGGESVHGFLCEPFAVEGALDISQHGGWRAYLAGSSPVVR
jgi:allophanate hydrolase